MFRRAGSLSLLADALGSTVALVNSTIATEGRPENHTVALRRAPRSAVRLQGRQQLCRVAIPGEALGRGARRLAQARRGLDQMVELEA